MWTTPDEILLRHIFTDGLFYVAYLHDFTYLNDDKTPKESICKSAGPSGTE